MTPYCVVSSPVGRLLLTGGRDGLRGISFQGGSHALKPAEHWTRTEVPFREAILQLEAYFAGELERFDLALAPEGTSFQREVWSTLQTIPYGETVSYGELARRIVIPCHRVIGADGSLTGFGGGLAIKRRLLAMEAGFRRELPGEQDPLFG